MANKFYFIGIIVIILGFGYWFVSQPRIPVSASEFPPIINGQQVVKMDASSTGYSPSYFKIKAGIPVRWEIANKGVSGCTNAILAPKLFSGPLNIDSFSTTVKEFTPPGPGTYRFTCWMGMISGTIEVVN